VTEAEGSRDDGRPGVVVVLPTSHERDNIARHAHAVLGLPCLPDVLVVDDSSADGTADLVLQLAAQFPGRVRLLKRPRRERPGRPTWAPSRRCSTGGVTTWSCRWTSTAPTDRTTSPALSTQGHRDRAAPSGQHPPMTAPRLRDRWSLASTQECSGGPPPGPHRETGRPVPSAIDRESLHRAPVVGPPDSRRSDARRAKARRTWRVSDRDSRRIVILHPGAELHGDRVLVHVAMVAAREWDVLVVLPCVGPGGRVVSATACRPGPRAATWSAACCHSRFRHRSSPG
jgi:glycosyltransferase involved in cell wall biosynthesis